MAANRAILNLGGQTYILAKVYYIMLSIGFKMSKNTSKKRAKCKPSPKETFFAPKKAKKAPQVALNSPEFNKLQDIWYKKATESGFKDLEGPEFKGGQSGLLKGGSLRDIVRTFKPETRHYYAKLRCYLTFNPQIPDGYGDVLGDTRQRACEMYIDGLSFRAILKQLKPKSGIRLNLFSLSKLIKHLENLSTIWNKVNHNGLDYIADIDL